MKSNKRLQNALNELANRFEGGHLALSTDPAGFLEMVIDRLDKQAGDQAEIVKSSDEDYLNKKEGESK
jgi:hypothetical protein